MSRLIGPVRLRLLVLTLLILATAYTAMPQQAASACIKCVGLTGGLCVGCDPNVTVGFAWCWPVQEDCSCSNWGTCDLIIN
jgi:hypothetical protein